MNQGHRFAAPGPDVYRYPLLIRHLLQSAMDNRSTNEIVGTDGRRHGYAELDRRIGRLGAVLTDLGVRPGDTIAVMDWDSHRYLEAYFAIPMLGAVLQMVNVRLSPEQIVFTLQDSGATLLLFHSDFAPLVADLKGRLPLIDRWIVMHDGAGVGATSADAEYEALLAAEAELHPFEDFDENALATTFHTTGTTGLPKRVAFSHRQLVLHTLAIMSAFSMRPERQRLTTADVYMPLTPMFHVHAWGLPYVATLMGVKQVYPGRYIPDRLIALQRQEDVTFSHGVPTILQMLLGALGDARPSRPWKMIVGGSALAQPLHDAAAAHDIHAFAGYGMSETAPVVTLARLDSDDPDEERGRARLAGQPIPLVQVRVVDTEMQDSAEGELVVRAPWLTAGYGTDEAASADLWRGGWLHTQDVARICDRGDVEIRDRLKDVIKTGGEWVSSTQIEELVMQYPDVAAAAVVGVPDARWGERPILFVVASGHHPTLAAMHAHLSLHVDRGAISRYALPDRLIMLDDLPRTSVGKIDKKALRNMLA
ncbi:fatty-acyl-CoA synthase [Sphingomonas gellani]|uniref:Fatty-acyl-CoA synthase n=1 Tax=Sphingomonas gellani TaxID=1166340 RepID=A0A1H8CPQ1_9SPHN|nr:long-chain-fatty-acid--CoA ligase [Sphingomonas gellani]SEM96862.1 fatty-acyl-CoA synthase [Sphingomonas gellani]